MDYNSEMSVQQKENVPATNMDISVLLFTLTGWGEKKEEGEYETNNIQQCGIMYSQNEVLILDNFKNRQQ